MVPIILYRLAVIGITYAVPSCSGVEPKWSRVVCKNLNILVMV